VYDKPMLSVAVARGLTLDRLVREGATQAAWRLGVRLLGDTHAVAIDALRQRLRTTRGTLRFRQLVLAHGAAPALPAAWAADAVWRINDLDAYRRLRTALGGAPRRLAIIGAGLVGCELANDLALAGHAITLIDQQPLPLGALLPAAASQRLQQAWAALPITFIGGAQVVRVARGNVALADGQVIDVDEVIAATGLRTPGRLARSAGLDYEATAGGIVVDPHTGRTSQAGIHALGDCVVVQGRASRFIEPIGRQAQAIAASLLGQPWAADEASEPVLRIKTSSLPITVRGGRVSAGGWQMTCP
jgi:rubredoxin-NAD+ reductase